MQPFIALYEELRKELNGIAVETPDYLQRSAQSVVVCKHYCREVNELVREHIFPSQQEEIEFFKNIQPEFLKELFFFDKLFQIESGKPIACLAGQKSYYTAYLGKLSEQLDQQRTFYHYYRLGRSDKDEKYFLRGATGATVGPELSLYMDGRCISAYTLKIAEIQAVEALSTHLVSLIDTLANPATVIQAGKPSLVWTDKDVFLVELVIGLHASGSVNYGKTDMKQLISAMELLFNHKVANFYQLVKSIRARKKERTTFLPLMADLAEKWMIDRD